MHEIVNIFFFRDTVNLSIEHKKITLAFIVLSVPLVPHLKKIKFQQRYASDANLFKNTELL